MNSKKKSLITPIILAGGSGTRLWPLSRAEKPKQFLNLINESSLLQLTLKRLKNNESINSQLLGKLITLIIFTLYIWYLSLQTVID